MNPLYLGEFGSTKQPRVILLVFDTATGTPQFALCQEVNYDLDAVRYNNTYVPIQFCVDKITFSRSAPSAPGGLVRNMASVTFMPNDSKGHPFSLVSGLRKEFFRGGQVNKDFYIEMWGCSANGIGKDIRKNSHFFGRFIFDVGTGWNESSGVTSVRLVDPLLVQTYRPGELDTEIESTWRIFNKWMVSFTGFPTVYGQVPRVKMVNRFPSFDLRDLTQQTGQFTVVSGPRYIILPAAEIEGSLIEELATITTGDLILYIRNLATDEVIRGRWEIDIDGNGELVILNRQSYYAKVKARYTSSSLNNTTAYTDFLSSQLITYNKVFSQIDDDPNKVLAPDGYLKGTFRFATYQDPSSITTTTAAYDLEILDVYVKLDGWRDIDQRHLRHEVINHPTDPSTFGYPSAFQLRYGNTDADGSYTIARRFVGQPTSGLTIADYVGKMLADPEEVELYFVVPGTLPDINNGDEWQLVNAEIGSVDADAYIRTSECEVVSNQFYAEASGRLVRIPVDQITSVTTDLTVGGANKLTRVRLTKPPLEMDIDATSNVIYCDTKYITGREHPSVILNALIQENQDGTIPELVRVEQELPYIGFVASGDSTLTEYLDKFLFQTGSILYYAFGKLYMTMSVQWPEWILQDHAGDINGEPVTEDYVKQISTIKRISDYDLNTAETSVDRIEAREIDENGFEYNRVYLFSKYGAWQDPFSDRFISNRVRRFPTRNYDQKEYNYDMMSDSVSHGYASLMSSLPGHASQYCTVARTFKFETGLNQLKYLPLDIIELNNFPNLTSDIEEYDGTNEALEIKDSDGNIYWQKNDNTLLRTLPGMCMIDSIESVFTAKDVRVMFTARMICGKINFLSGSLGDIPEPQFPDIPPIPNPDPNIPPIQGIGGGGAGNPNYPLIQHSIGAPVYNPGNPIDSDEQYDVTIPVTFYPIWYGRPSRGCTVFVRLVSTLGENIGCLDFEVERSVSIGNVTIEFMDPPTVLNLNWIYNSCMFFEGPESTTRSFDIHVRVAFNGAPGDSPGQAESLNYEYVAGQVSINLGLPPPLSS